MYLFSSVCMPKPGFCQHPLVTFPFIITFKPCTKHAINAHSFKTEIGTLRMSFSKFRDSNYYLDVHTHTNKT